MLKQSKQPTNIQTIEIQITATHSHYNKCNHQSNCHLRITAITAQCLQVNGVYRRLAIQLLIDHLDRVFVVLFASFLFALLC